jgi:D-alanyl-D-alanine carboxypeptidase (penicillin-binding protein 5/6)
MVNYTKFILLLVGFFFYAFNSFGLEPTNRTIHSVSFKPIFKANEIIATTDVWHGEYSKVNLISKQDVELVLDEVENIDQAKITLNYDNVVLAPIKQGQKIGVIVIEMSNRLYMVSSLVANEDVAEGSFIKKILQNAFLRLKAFIS